MTFKVTGNYDQLTYFTREYDVDTADQAEYEARIEISDMDDGISNIEIKSVEEVDA